MGLHSDGSARHHIVVDNIHGDISLFDREWDVVNTATFQRLRGLKQLGMGHLVYPNATHNRFAHSLGVFAIMCRIVQMLRDQNYQLEELGFENLRLAALLHDIGHYPYSHLMERIDDVTLMEDEIVEDGKRTVSAETLKYPGHEALGCHILTEQKDICDAIGGRSRAQEIGALFSRTDATNPQLSKLIHSSLDMDRLDYLLRDARAAGVPFGEIDLNYLLNSIRISPKGMLGVGHKALAAAEHFLLARLFMHRVVYYHKTIYGFEEACRQLLRRARDKGKFKLFADGKAVEECCAGSGLSSFTDDYVDRIIREAAADDSDAVMQTLARCITSRRPPKLLMEVSGLQEKGEDFHEGTYFRGVCKAKLQGLAEEHGIPLGQFLLCELKPIKIEERGPRMTRNEKLKPEEKEELIMVFKRDQAEPTSIVDIKHTVINHLSGHYYGIHRLYLADLAADASVRVEAIKREVQKWAIPT